MATNPHTPRAGRELDRTIESLNNRFFLQLPNPAFSSPSSRLRANDRSSTDIQCAGIIKFLFYKARPKLDRLITDFEEWARPMITRWQFKERQEPGTLPTPIERSFIRRDVAREITPEERLQLLAYLQRLLNDEYYLIMGRSPLTADQNPSTDPDAHTNGRVYDARGDTRDQTYPRANLFPLNRDPNRTSNQRSTMPSEDSSRSRPSLSSTAATSFSGPAKRKSEDHEVFTTAPNSPISTSPVLDELLDEFEHLDLNDFDLDLDSITKADVGVDVQRSSSAKKKGSPKKQSTMERYMEPSAHKTREPVRQVNKSAMRPPEDISFITNPPSIFSRNTSLLGTSFGSNNTEATEPLDDTSSTQGSSMRDVFDDEEFRTSFNAACVGEPIFLPNSADDATISELLKDGPFARKRTFPPKIPLRYRYELQRIATSWQLPIEKVLAGDQAPFSTHTEFWKWVSGHSHRAGNALPEKSPARAWNHAVNQFQDTGKKCDAVILSGELDWCEKSEPGFLKLNLKPMKLERSCRFYRRFGSDRFLVVTIPYPSKAPTHLSSSLNPLLLQQSIAKWLSTNEHNCLGRVWRAFYLEELKVKAVKGKERPEMRMKIHLFAVDGIDFVGTSPRHSQVAPENQLSEQHTPMSVEALINWHMPFGPNIKQTDCKLFQRFSLGLSKTIPSVVLKTEEIFRLEDTPGKTVMNDGCARMSRSLAIHIADLIDIGGITPSCLQGRIAGAKGIWMVDRDDTAFKAGDRNFWIQISDSQLKIKPHPAEVNEAVDPEKLTFEVVNWSKPLRAVDLNIQLLTILEHRGVKREYVERLIRDQIKSLYDEFVEIVGGGNRLGCRRLMQKLRPPGDDWARKKTRRIGGWPMDDAEQIILLLESGFDPLTCSFLTDLLKKCLTNFLDRYVDRLQIGVPLSTYAYCIADPYGVLKQDEVYFGLSQAWDDPTFSDTIFEGFDVLVGRLPAHYPSDIQKRRAVYRPELRHLKDVIVFPTQGNIPLAHMLSGGDYDGDTPWICWDPEMVSSFENVGLPVEPSEDEFGLIKHAKPMRQLNLNSADEFIYNSFNFNFKPSLLGICTVEHEKLAYDKTIDCDAAMRLSGLLSFLVDSRKAGVELTEGAWRSILTKISRKQRQLPAYKSTDSRKPKPSNIIDYLKFNVAEGEKENVLADFSKVQINNMSANLDEDLTRIWNTTLDQAETEKKEGKPELRTALKALQSGIKSAQDVWSKLNGPGKGPFAVAVQASADAVQDIKPLEFEHGLSWTWRNSDYEWDRLRASCLYKHCYKTKFPWYAVGETLCKTKAEANTPTRTLTEDIYLAHRLDSKRSMRIEARASNEEGGDEEEDEDEEIYEDEDIFLDADFY